MKTYSQPGDRLNYTNPSSTSVASGGTVVRLQTGTLAAAGCVAVVIDDIPASAQGTVLVEGVIQTTQILATDTWAQGVPLFWDSVNSRFTSTSTDTYAGRAAEAKATNVATGAVHLNFK
jgi:predicted RecA/RadA family phage recombinase